MTTSQQCHCSEQIDPKCHMLLLILIYWLGKAWMSGGKRGQDGEEI